MKKTLIKLLLIGLLIIAFAQIADAQAGLGISNEYKPDNTPFPIDFTNETKDAGTYTITILRILAGALLWFAAPVAVILIVINALNMAKGGADSEQLEQAKKGLTWTLIGLVVIILSYAIVKTVISFTIEVAENTTISSNYTENTKYISLQSSETTDLQF